MFIFIPRNTRVILEEESGTELTTVENQNKPHYVKEEFGKFNIHSCLLKKLFESLIIILVTLQHHSTNDKSRNFIHAAQKEAKKEKELKTRFSRKTGLNLSKLQVFEEEVLGAFILS